MPIALPVLLGALVHDCANPISEARAHVEDVYRQVRKVRRSLRQLSHVFHALMSVKGQLAGHGGQLLPGRPRQIHQAIANIPNYRRIDLDVPAGLQVTASPGTLETVLAGLVRNAREHAPRATTTIIANEPTLPNIAERLPRLARPFAMAHAIPERVVARKRLDTRRSTLAEHIPL